jgi:arylsulfatase A-like enzyme
LLKPLGYATGQFGKNHLGDRNNYLPTVHGFDEFFGNLYHLNAEEDPEDPDYPSEKEFPQFSKSFRPRGVLHCFASDKDDAAVDPCFGRVAKQRIKDTGPLTRKRMETIDDEIADKAIDFIKSKSKEGTPFFCWVNFTHMHLRTHPKPESVGQAGRWQSTYHDTMIGPGLAEGLLPAPGTTSANEADRRPARRDDHQQGRRLSLPDRAPARALGRLDYAHGPETGSVYLQIGSAWR